MSLEERFRTVLPMLTRQIEALNLLQKSRKLGPAAAAKVTAAPRRSGGLGNLLTLRPVPPGADGAEGRRGAESAVPP